MSVRSLAHRIAITAAAGALTAVAVTGSAFAAGADPQPVGEDSLPGVTNQLPSDHTAETQWSPDSHRYYKGRVIARSGLLLREAPTRSSDVIGSKPYGAYVHIYCKTKGDNVDGNWRWYLLADGTWAWASARYIENIGPAPRWC
ncbi:MULTISPECIES: SH3 domain-containing protein [Streptomyces]|uniref:SH3 domain-containing protein n=1 Tax=Streptomyces TaxID=1883 RepID=UPI00058EE78A|nr:SH3 domain-containing protein [Streptomyces sp. SCSIO ZS0520]AYN32457.1 SH3 domain-containing protein [Streptomyces albus]